MMIHLEKNSGDALPAADGAGNGGNVPEEWGSIPDSGTKGDRRQNPRCRPIRRRRSTAEHSGKGF